MATLSAPTVFIEIVIGGSLVKKQIVVTVTLLAMAFVQVGWSDEDPSPYNLEVSSPNEVHILHRGPAALEKRLQMIEGAQESIVLEYLVYNTDFVAKVLTQALLERAREGVEVRILVDGSFEDKRLNRFHAHFLAQEGIELRYYNKLSLPYLFRYNHRNNRKLLVVDGAELITGGRDIADKYFELDKDFNFIDRDIWVKSSELAGAAMATFEDYWNSALTSVPRALPTTPTDDDVASAPDGRGHYREHLIQLQEKERRVRDFLVLTEEEEQVLEDLRVFSREQLASGPLKGSCARIAFAADSPKEGKVRLRELAEVVYKNVLSVEEELYVESGLLLLDDPSKGALKKLMKRGVSMWLLTNSFYASEHSIFGIAFRHLSRWMSKIKGLRAFAYDGGAPPHEDFFFQETYSSRFATHSKTIVFDGNSFLIGSYSLGNRFQSSNSDVGIFCYDSPELAQGILDNIQQRQDASTMLDENGRYPFLYRVPFVRRVLYYVLYIPTQLLDLLLQ